MRLSTVFISCVFVLAGTSTGIAIPVGGENMLMARFTDAYFTPEVEARAYNMEADSYTHGGAVSENNFKPSSRRHRRSLYEPPRINLTRRRADKIDPNLPQIPINNDEPDTIRITPPPETPTLPGPVVAPAPQPAVAQGHHPAVAPGLQLTLAPGPHATPTPAPRQ